MVNGINRYDFVTQFNKLKERVKRLEIGQISKHANVHLPGGSDPVITSGAQINGEVQTWVPQLINDGSAVYTATGMWSYLNNSVIYVTGVFDITTAGSGTGTGNELKMTLPVEPDRTTQTAVIPMFWGDTAAVSLLGMGYTIPSGVGTSVLDRIRRTNSQTDARAGTMFGDGLVLGTDGHLFIRFTGTYKALVPVDIA